MATFFKTGLGKFVALLLFTVFSIACIVYLLAMGGVRIPFVSSTPYELSFETKNVGNLVALSDVSIAGAKVGKVRAVTNHGDHATVRVELESSAAPLHRGAKVNMASKTLIGESIVDIDDGNGSPLPSGTSLPSSAVKPPVQVRDVLASLNPETRRSLGSLSRTLGDATAGSKSDIANAMEGLGNLGREGYTALDAISAQSKDLTALAQ